MKNLNLKNPSMDSSSKLSLQSNPLAIPNQPFIYEVRDCYGNRFRHCGSQKDADYHVLRNRGYTWEKVYLDPTPQTVDVTSETLPGDPQLPEQKILPESELERFIF